MAHTRPLEGIRVLAIEHFIAGPYASMWLADQGAEVIKVERPRIGDQARDVGPFRDAPDGESRSLGLVRSNRNKYSITLDIKTPDGLAVFKKLVRASDVVLENLRAHTMDDLGAGYEALRQENPRLIYTSVSGFGHEDVMPGPYVTWPAFDVITQALSGLMYRPARNGPNPVYLGFPLTDLFAAALGFAGTVQALYARTITGLGQHVDIAMYDGAIVLNELALVTRDAMQQFPDSGTHFQAAPFGGFHASDGYLSIAVFSDKNWRNLCRVMGDLELADDPRYAAGRSRAQRHQEVREIVERWLIGLKADDAAEQLRSAGIAAAVVVDVDSVLTSQQAAARQMVLTLQDPAWGEIHVAGNPIKTSTSPNTATKPAPRLGEDTRRLLGDILGMSSADMDTLADAGVI
jgi:CoA:oxalate CoA-transferase